jgi:hypothetical protein
VGRDPPLAADNEVRIRVFILCCGAGTRISMIKNFVTVTHPASTGLQKFNLVL